MANVTIKILLVTCVMYCDVLDITLFFKIINNKYITLEFSINFTISLK